MSKWLYDDRKVGQVTVPVDETISVIRRPGHHATQRKDGNIRQSDLSLRINYQSFHGPNEACIIVTLGKHQSKLIVTQHVVAGGTIVLGEVTLRITEVTDSSIRVRLPNPNEKQLIEMARGTYVAS